MVLFNVMILAEWVAKAKDPQRESIGTNIILITDVFLNISWWLVFVFGFYHKNSRPTTPITVMSMINEKESENFHFRLTPLNKTNYVRIPSKHGHKSFLASIRAAHHLDYNYSQLPSKTNVFIVNTYVWSLRFI